MTKEEFALSYSQESKISLEQFHVWFTVEACDCGEEGCNGWKAVNRVRFRTDNTP